MSTTRPSAKDLPSPPADAITLEQAAEILDTTSDGELRLIENGHLKPWSEKPALMFSRAQIRAYHTRSKRVQRKALEEITAISEEFDL